MKAKKFELNNKHYSTDTETLTLLRSIIPSAKKNNDFSAVNFIMFYGLKTGQITEI